MKSHMVSRLTPWLVSLVVLGSPVGLAQTDTFDDGNDAGWTRYNPLQPFGAGGSYSFPSGAYRIQAPASPDPATLGPARVGSLFPAATFTRVEVQADLFGWDNSLTQSVGLFARAGNLGLGTTTGYTYNYNILSGFHQITFVLNEAAGRQVNESQFRLNPEHRYRMRFIAAGKNLLGHLYSSTNLVTPVHSVFGLDETYTSGRCGIFAFAIDPFAAVDGRFDNFAVSVPGRTRATLLDSSPAVGELPSEAVGMVAVRLAHVETQIQPETIRLLIDGSPVTFELQEFASILTLTHQALPELVPNQSHQISVRFNDDDGEQTFTWSFGPPMTRVAQLQGTPRLGVAFTTQTNAQFDADNRTFSVPLDDTNRFFRIEDTTARTIREVGVTGGMLQIRFE